MTDRRWTGRVPARLVLVLAVVVATAASATLAERGVSAAAPAGPTDVRALAAGGGVVRFTGTSPVAASLPPATAAGADAPEPDAPEPDAPGSDAIPATDPTPVPEPAPEPVDEHATARPGDVPGRMLASPLPLLDREELAATAARVGIPERALAAYASAALLLREQRPSCNLTWVTLAGIGYVESHHGTIGGRQLRPDGSVSRPIVGVPLDGGPDVRAIADTDGGRLDGDARWDRAVGPLQFIPTTWERWAADGDGDGTADPQHIDDATLAAARYLCASGSDLAASGNWGRAMWSYNRSEDYIRHVLAVANTYAARANGG